MVYVPVVSAGIQKLLVGNGQALPVFFPSAREHVPAAAVFHAGPEPMFPFALPVACPVQRLLSHMVSSF
jgi:hypothetical protein